MHVHVIHENAAWLEPLARALDAERLPWRDWFLDRGVFDLSRAAPRGRLLQPHERVVAHPRPPLCRRTDRLGAGLARRARKADRQRAARARPGDFSKARQYAALEAAGIKTPRTVLVAGKDQLVAAAREALRRRAR